jgi:hypothetical protein
MISICAAGRGVSFMAEVDRPKDECQCATERGAASEDWGWECSPTEPAKPTGESEPVLVIDRGGEPARDHGGVIHAVSW